MPSIELTENLRTTIRDLRKKKKKRGDELSKELGKGASYISQIENGKIKEIDFNLLDEIFHRITDLPGKEYTNFINSLLDNAASHMTEEELQHEKWVFQFDYEIRKYPISDALIKFIKDKLLELNYTPEEFVALINENRELADDNSIDESNKVKIDIFDRGNGSYGVISSIKFDLPQNFISDILSKKTTTINYVNMQGILFNIFISEGCSTEDAQEHANTLLDQNQFYTIRKRNELIRNNLKAKMEQHGDFNFYDIQPTDYDKQYMKIRHDITRCFDIVKDRDILYACDRLQKIAKNMHFDLGLAIALMSSPICKIPATQKKTFWNDYKEFLSKYISTEEASESSIDKADKTE